MSLQRVNKKGRLSAINGRQLTSFRKFVVCSAISAVMAGSSIAFSAEYRVQQGDTIEISVAGIPELRQRSTVQPDGAVAVPLVGAVMVEGLTPSELRGAFQTQLGHKVYRHWANDDREFLTVIQPEEVSAAIVMYRPLYVTGDVAKSGEQAFLPDMTVRQALALAGGVELSQARLPKWSRDLSSLRTDYELAVNEYVQATARGARVFAELNGANDVGDPDPQDAQVGRERLAEIRKSEADILRVRNAAYARERDFLAAAVTQADDRIAVVQKQQAEEVEGTRADTLELQRLVELLNKGQEINPRITDARRALLMSSTRALQVNVELLELKRQRAESARAVQRFEDDRRIALVKDLQDSTSAKAAARVKIDALGPELGLLKEPIGADGDEANMQRSIEVVRQDRATSSKVIVDDDFVLMPGDVITVMLRPPQKSADAGP